MVANKEQKVISRLLLLFFGGLVASVEAHLPVRNQNPFALLQAVPELQDSVRLMPGQQQVSLTQTISNHWSVESAAEESVFIDGEGLVTDFTWRVAWLNAEIAFMLPYVSYRRGQMDDFIERFHQVFSLPNGGRDAYPQNQFTFAYNGQMSQRLTSPSSGVGDFRLLVGIPLPASSSMHHRLYGQIKAANGNEGKWLGSGAYNTALFISSDWFVGRLMLQWQYGLQWQGKSDAIVLDNKRWVPIMSLAGAYSLSHQWQAVVQLDAHGALYDDSTLAQFDSAILFSMGVKWADAHWGGHIAFIEDLAVETAPDFGLQFGFSYKY